MYEILNYAWFQHDFKSEYAYGHWSTHVSSITSGFATHRSSNPKREEREVTSAVKHRTVYARKISKEYWID